MPHKFDPDHAHHLDSTARRQMLPPEATLRRLGAQAGMRVVDLGAGTGFFTLPLAGLVGPEGRVWAVDISLAMLERVRERVHDGGLVNVETVHGGEAEVPLPAGVADLVLLSSVLHEAEGPVSLLREAGRLLRPGGRVALIEWKAEPTGHGPPLAERLSPAQVAGYLQGAGLAVLGPAMDLGPGHYGLLAERT